MLPFDTIIFIGPQGSGKGTQAQALAKRLNFFYWEMGAILREIAKEDSDLGRRVSVIHKGILLDDDTLFEVITDKLEQLPAGEGVIFDGIPRRLGQAKFLLQYLEAHGHAKIVTIFIDVPREESMKRLLRRAEIEGRKDDTPETIEFRLNQYTKETVPVLSYLQDETRFIDIDGKPSIPEVTQEIATALHLDNA